MRTMGPPLVVELPPAFDEHLGLGAAAEPFPVQQFVTQFSIEALDESVLPWTAGRDEGRTDCSVSHLGSSKFGAVVRPNERGLAVHPVCAEPLAVADLLLQRRARRDRQPDC